MKKICFLTLFVISTLCNAQKNKNRTTTKVIPQKNTILATLDQISAEIIAEKNTKRTVLLIKNSTSKDTLEIKNNGNTDFKPTDFTLKKFTNQGKNFYLVQWKDIQKTETKVLKENAITTTNQIWEIDSKTLHIENIQKTTQISEIIFLDKNKTASHTVDKAKSEGFEFILNADGTFTLKTKSQNNSYQYQNNSKKFELINASKSNYSTKNKK